MCLQCLFSVNNFLSITSPIFEKILPGVHLSDLKILFLKNMLKHKNVKCGSILSVTVIYICIVVLRNTVILISHWFDYLSLIILVKRLYTVLCIYKLKRCSNKECCKQCRYVMFKGTMTKWPVQKLAQGTTQKLLQHHDATNI